MMHVEICRRVLIKSTQHLHCDTHGYKNYFFFFFLQKHLCTFFVWVIGNQNEIKKKLQRKTVFIFTLHYIFLQLSVELAWSKGIYVSKVNRLSLCHGPWVLNTFYLSFLLLLWSQSFGFKFDSLWCNWFVKKRFLLCPIYTVLVHVFILILACRAIVLLYFSYVVSISFNKQTYDLNVHYITHA